MGRSVISIETLHGYTIEELIKLKNSTSSMYTRIFLTVIAIRYQGYTNAQMLRVPN